MVSSIVTTTTSGPTGWSPSPRGARVPQGRPNRPRGQAHQRLLPRFPLVVSVILARPTTVQAVIATRTMSPTTTPPLCRGARTWTTTEATSGRPTYHHSKCPQTPQWPRQTKLAVNPRSATAAPLCCQNRCMRWARRVTRPSFACPTPPPSPWSPSPPIPTHLRRSSPLPRTTTESNSSSSSSRRSSPNLFPDGLA